MSQRSANGSTSRWRKLRAEKLARNPTCQLCNAEPATEVDHIVQLKEWPGGRYVWSNLRAVGPDCHKLRHGKRPKVRIDPTTGLPEPGQHHWWS